MPSRKVNLLGLPPIVRSLAGVFGAALLATLLWGWLGFISVAALIGLALVVLSRSGTSAADRLRTITDMTNGPAFAVGAVAFVFGLLVMILAWRMMKGASLFEAFVVMVALAAFVTWATFAARALGLVNTARDPGRDEERETPER